MKINNFSILTVSVAVCALGVNSAFSTVQPPAPIVFNALPPLVDPAKAAADAAAQQAATDAAAKATADAVQKSVTDATAALVAAQAVLTVMTTDAKTVSILKGGANAAANQALAKIQSDAATNIMKKITDASATIQNAVNTINASVSAAPGNSDVTKTVSDVTKVRVTADGIVAAANADVSEALVAITTKPA